MGDNEVRHIKSLQRQLCCIRGKNKPIYITYQDSSSTFPNDQNLGSWLIVTDDGTESGNVLEMWIFNGESWSEIPTSSSSLPQNVIDALLNSNSPSESNPFATIADITSGSFSLPYVANYTALSLIDPLTVPNEVYNVLNGENASWRPAWLGGTYYPKGIYQSIAGVWEYIGDFPYQAPQIEVDAGTNNNKFVTPSTLNNSVQWTTKENVISSGTTSQYWRGDKTFQTLDKTTVGLSNVDNTSDANKPISTATQTALNAKQDTIVLFKSTTQTIVTGKTVETSIYSIPLPNDGFNYMIKIYSQAQISTFAGSTIVQRLRVGTFATVIDGAVGANSIGQQANLGGNSLSTNLQIPVTRNFIYKGGASGSITGAPNNANILDDANSQSSFVLLTSRDLTVQNYLYVTFNPSNSGAIVSHGQILVTAIKTS